MAETNIFTCEKCKVEVAEDYYNYYNSQENPNTCAFCEELSLEIENNQGELISDNIYNMLNQYKLIVDIIEEELKDIVNFGELTSRTIERLKEGIGEIKAQTKYKKELEIMGRESRKEG